MSLLNEKYKNITEKRISISKEIKELLETDVVKRYFELCRQDKNLANRQ